MFDHELEVFLFNEKSLNLYINKEELYKFELYNTYFSSKKSYTHLGMHMAFVLI